MDWSIADERMKRRLIIGFMLAAISAVLLLSAWLFLPNLVVQYHLWAIEQDRDAPQHIASLVQMGRLARPELFRVRTAEPRVPSFSRGQLLQ
jgi:hypothetical protein